MTASDFMTTRRAFLGRYAGGLGSLALAHLFAAEGRGQQAPPRDLLAPRPPHHPDRKSVV